MQIICIYWILMLDQDHYKRGNISLPGVDHPPKPAYDSFLSSTQSSPWTKLHLSYSNLLKYRYHGQNKYCRRLSIMRGSSSDVLRTGPWSAEERQGPYHVRIPVTLVRPGVTKSVAAIIRTTVLSPPSTGDLRLKPVSRSLTISDIRRNESMNGVKTP